MALRFRLPSADPWAYTTWDGARLKGLIESANWSLAEKLAWLERVTELAAHVREARSGGAVSSSPSVHT